MVVSNTTSKVTYTGNGSTDTYAFDFKIFEDADLVVTKVTIATEVEEVLALGTDYTVLGAGDDDGGSVVLTAGNLSSDYKLVIQRVLPLTQEVDYTPSDKFPAETHEEALDRAMMIAQQLKEEIGRCVKVGVGGNVPSVEDLNDAVSDAQIAQTGAEAAQGLSEDARDAAVIAKNAAEAAAASTNVHKYDLTFGNADLSTGVLTVTHNLNSSNVSVEIRDNNGKRILEDDSNATGVNTVTVDLTSYGTLTGNWSLKVIA